MIPEEQIRAEYVECLARTAYEHRPTADAGDVPWDELFMVHRERWLEWGELYADALAAKGLLPTFARWEAVPTGTADYDYLDEGFPDRQGAQVKTRQWIGGGTIVRYLATDWHDAPTAPEEGLTA